MLDATILKYAIDNWPQTIAIIALVLIGWRANHFTTSQFLNNRRTRKLMKLHAKRHESDGAYLFDDSIE
jgi:hypothetical protein